MLPEGKRKGGIGMKNLMNELSELVYMVNLETYDLEFINEAGRKVFGTTGINKCKCYEVLYGKNEPCTFCNNCQLSEEAFLTWECCNEKVGRHYLMKDSLINWNGKKLKIEIARDITNQRLQKEVLQEMMDGQNMIADCVKLLHSADNILLVLDAVIERIGSYTGAERAYIYISCPEEGVEGAHVWCNPDSSLSHSDVSGECNLSWRHKTFFQNQDCISLADINVLRSRYPEEYSIMANKGVTSLVTAPLQLENSCVGYIEIDNLPPCKINKVVPLVRTLAYFISSCMCNCKNQRRLGRLIYTDSLTEVKNRHAYNETVEELASKKFGKVGILYVDINDMKGLNDRFGHDYGDHILVDLSEKISCVFDRNDIFRIDGDEFIVICQNISKSEFIEKIHTFECNMDKQHEYVVSVGYQWSDRQENIKDLITASDRMMYEHKKGYYFDRPMPRHCRYQYDEIKELLNPDTLWEKLAKGEFPIYFQPKMAVSDKSLIGAEALIRYQNPDGCIVSPDRFIPILEEKHLIDIVDTYVYEVVCRQIVQWRKRGLPVVPVSVNFSRYSLMEIGFLEHLERIATSYGINKKLLEIEVTESADTDESFDFLGMIKKIRSAGFSVSIDDFGVKFANLFLFTTVDFDVLKIDKSLTKDLVRNEKAKEVLRSISDICKRIGISMIVEGIETEDQLNLLKEMGCYGVQGYYFSRPIPLAEYETSYMAKKERVASA